MYVYCACLHQITLATYQILKKVAQQFLKYKFLKPSISKTCWIFSYFSSLQQQTISVCANTLLVHQF